MASPSAELPTVSDVTAIVSRYVEANVAMAVLDNEVPYDEAANRAWTELLDALERLYAAVQQGREDSARFDVLWRALPFREQHRFGGDEREAREGVDVLRARGVASEVLATGAPSNSED